MITLNHKDFEILNSNWKKKIIHIYIYIIEKNN